MMSELCRFCHSDSIELWVQFCFEVQRMVKSKINWLRFQSHASSQDSVSRHMVVCCAAKKPACNTREYNLLTGRKKT